MTVVNSTPVIAATQTAAGLARLHVWAPDSAEAAGTLVLGHGAGGWDWSADLRALTGLTSAGWLVVLVEQPWRVAGRKVAAPARQLDTAWRAVLDAIRGGAADRAAGTGQSAPPRPLIVGGRSAGARVACRTAVDVAADRVLCLAFPLHPPGRPESSRAGELQDVLQAGLPLLVVQGASDPFGRPAEIQAALGTAPVWRPAAPAASAPAASGPAGWGGDSPHAEQVRLVEVAGGHSFATDPQDVVRAVSDWLAA